MPRTSRKLTQRWSDRLADYVTGLVWSPDGSQLAAVSAAGEVALWADGRRQFTFQAEGAQSAIAFSSDGRLLAAGGQDGSARLWELAANSEGTRAKPLRQYRVEGWIDDLAWHPRLPHLAANGDRCARVWDASWGEIATLDFVDSSVLGLAWHPEGMFLAACGHAGVRVWTAEDWTADPYLLRVPGASLDALWSPDGRYLAAGNMDRTLSVLAWGSPPPWLMQGFPGKVRQLSWSEVAVAGEPLLAAACHEGIAVWQRREDWSNQILEGHCGFVRAIAFQPGQLTLASTGDDGRVCLWSQAKRLEVTLKGPAGRSRLAWHPGGERLAVAGQTGEVSVWQEVRREAKGFGG